MADEGGAFEVTVCYALPDSAWQKAVRVRAGATMREAIAASGFAEAFPDVDAAASGAGIRGQMRAGDHPLQPQDRIDIYRPLAFDPMESRRRRAEHKKRQFKRGAKLSKARQAGG